MFAVGRIWMGLVFASTLVQANAENYTAEILPAQVFGTYVNVPELQSANYDVEVRSIFPLPKGVQEDADSAISVYQEGDEYAIRYTLAPTYSRPWKFRLNERRNITAFGNTVQFLHTLERSQDNSTTVLIREIVSAKGKLLLRYEFNDNGLKVIFKRNQTEASRFYKRALPYAFDGTYQDLPERATNWGAFVYSDAGQPVLIEPSPVVRFYRDNDQYYYHRVPDGAVFPFTLGTTVERMHPVGNITTITFSSVGGGSDTVLRLVAQVAGGSSQLELNLTFVDAGIHLRYRKNNVEARRFSRRVIPDYVLGVYESNPDSEDFITFANTIRSPELLQKTTIELVELPDHSYLQKFTTGNDSTVDFPFTLGVPLEKTMKGRSVEYTYRFAERTHPVLSTSYAEKNGGPLKFDVIGVYNGDGYTATYLFGDKRASRTYSRKP